MLRFVALLLLLLMTGPLPAAPKAELWDYWQAHDPQSTERIDHSAWDRFLQRYVTPSADGINRVAYGQVTSTDRQALDNYIQQLAAVPVSRRNRDEQRALWINLYNALTVQVILEHYPVASIRDIDISPGLFSSGPWGKKLLKIDGEQVSLDDIEHRILRPLWRDARLHYAVNCASLGCPNLPTRAFTAANTEQLLEQGARDYINHPRGVHSTAGQLTVSRIYDWFQADFGGNEAGVLAHLRRYARPELARQLANFSQIGDYAYDWSLNGL